MSESPLEQQFSETWARTVLAGSNWPARTLNPTGYIRSGAVAAARPRDARIAELEQQLELSSIGGPLDVDAWAELHRLRCEVKGPDGFETWKDAAVAERVRRVAAEKERDQAQARLVPVGWAWEEYDYNRDGPAGWCTRMEADTWWSDGHQPKGVRNVRWIYGEAPASPAAAEAPAGGIVVWTGADKERLDAAIKAAFEEGTAVNDKVANIVIQALQTRRCGERTTPQDEAVIKEALAGAKPLFLAPPTSKPAEATPEIISAMHAAYWGKPVFVDFSSMSEESRNLWRKTYRAAIDAVTKGSHA